jgi:cytochrome c-type biogenesis protein CcmH
MTRRFTLPLLHLACAWLCILGLTGGHVAAQDDVIAAKALALEQKLMAPCCYQQTLDIHRSELADALRKEIRERLANGEQAASIQEGIVAQYGERVMAVPASSPLEAVALVIMFAVVGAGLWLWLRARVWARTAPAHQQANEAQPEAEDPYDRALNEALERRFET